MTTKKQQPKLWHYCAYSSYRKPRSIVHRATVVATTRAMAIAYGQILYGDAGRYCTAVAEKGVKNADTTTL
jgi:hypothetical protein